MTVPKGEDMTPAEVGLWLLETALNVVVGALLVTGAAAGVVWLVTKDAPVGLLVTTAVLAVGFVLVHSRHSELSARLTYSRQRHPES